MSFDFQIFHCNEQESPEDAYLQVFSDISSFEGDELYDNTSNNAKVVELLQEHFDFEEFANGSSIELVDSKAGVSFELFSDGQMFIELAGWNIPVSVAYEVLDPYLRVIGSVGGYWAFDTQLNTYVDLSKGVLEQARGESLIESGNGNCYSLRFSSSKRNLTDETFGEYFQARNSFLLDSRSHRAAYLNTKTDVSFEMAHCLNHSSNLGPGERAVFKMAYMVPSVFAEEAVTEISEFCERFELLVTDDEYFHKQAFDAGKFKKGWGEASLFKLRKRLFKGEDVRKHAFPEARIRHLWYWNRGISAKSELKAQLINIDAQVKTTALWKPSTLAITPIVETVLLVLSKNEFCLLDLDSLDHSGFVRERDGVKGFKISPIQDFEKCRRSGVLLDNVFERVIPLSRVIESEVLESAMEANSKSSKSCLAPPREWE